ncbi:MAG: hypothetical protein KAI17_07985 [Thiotrichaceae bacterium]|nr:hypothetical protein [Thiotrichaceae bacterium]
MQLETKLSAKFITDNPCTPEEQISLDALNMHTEEIAEKLQSTFRLLIIEMLEIKRANFTKEKINAGS